MADDNLKVIVRIERWRGGRYFKSRSFEMTERDYERVLTYAAGYEVQHQNPAPEGRTAESGDKES